MSKPVVVELGCGKYPTPGAIHHDRIKHSADVDVAHDLELLPWPWHDGAIDKLIALDVMEHLRLDIPEWLNECWRVLKAGGQLVLRLPAWDNPVSYRDPTHRRVFHFETFHYFDPRTALYRDFGSIYFAESDKWWTVDCAERAHGGLDLGFVLTKVAA